MTREEAIEIIQKLIGRFKSDSRTYKALEMAIQALSQEPTSEKELNKAYTFGHNKGVKAYYNEQLCTVELPEAVFEYILSLVPTEETEQEPCDKCKYFDGNSCQHYDYKVGYMQGYAVLDKIRAEIEKPLRVERYADTESAKAQAIALSWCLEIIDKYTE